MLDARLRTNLRSQRKLENSASVDWTFNGWGGRTFPDCAADAHIARFIAGETGATRLPSLLVNEGGGIHIDGEGTLLLTETVQLNRNRNPNWSRAEAEAELHRHLGSSKSDLVAPRASC